MFIPELEGRLGRGVDCRPLEVPPGEGQSAAILGLRQFAESSGRCPPLVLEAPPSRDRAERAGMPAYVKWASLAAVLGLACAAMRYAETFWRGPALARQVAAWQAVTNNQPAVDRELSFYQYLATNRPPYLAALAQLAEAAGRGTSIGTLTMDRQGDLSLRGVMPSSQQATEFRSKLVRSGWFTEVVLEEQTPVGNEPKVNVRIGAHWRHAATGQAATAKDKDSPGPDAPPSPEREPDASPGPSEPPAPTVILTP